MLSFCNQYATRYSASDTKKWWTLCFNFNSNSSSKALFCSRLLSTELLYTLKPLFWLRHLQILKVEKMSCIAVTSISTSSSALHLCSTDIFSMSGSEHSWLWCNWGHIKSVFQVWKMIPTGDSLKATQTRSNMGLDSEKYVYPKGTRLFFLSEFWVSTLWYIKHMKFRLKHGGWLSLRRISTLRNVSWLCFLIISLNILKCSYETKLPVSCYFCL